MKTRTLLIVCAPVLALALVMAGMAVRKADRPREKPMRSRSAGRQSTIGPATSTVADEAMRDRSAGRDGDGGGTAGGSRALSARQAGADARLDAESASPDAPAGAAASRASHQRMTGHNNQIPESTRISMQGTVDGVFQKKYGEFFERNALPEDQREFIQDRSRKWFALNDELRSQGMSEEEIRKHMAEQTRKDGEAINDLLGDEVYQAWLYYGYTTPQRNLASDLSLRFDGMGTGMTGEQKDQLVDIFFRNHVAYYSTELLRNHPGVLQRASASFRETQEPVMREAADVLAPQQMTALRQFWSETINSPH
jgi:hypothetical protein